MPDYSLLTHRGNFNPWDVYAIMQARTDNMQAKYDEYMDALEELGKDWAQWDARVNPETEGKTREIYEGVMNGIRNEADRLAQHGLDFGMRRRLMDHRLDSTKAMTRISDAWTNRAAMLTDYQKKRDADASWMPERDLTLPENYSLDNWLDNPQYNWGHDISANLLAAQVSGQLAHIADQLTGANVSSLNGVERMLVEQYGYTPERVAAEMQRFLADPGAYMESSDGNDLISTAIAATLQGNGVDGDNGNWLSEDQRRRLYGQIASIFSSTIGKNTASHYTDHAALARLQASLSNPNPSNGGGGGGGKGDNESDFYYASRIQPHAEKDSDSVIGNLVIQGMMKDGDLDFSAIRKKLGSGSPEYENAIYDLFKAMGESNDDARRHAKKSYFDNPENRSTIAAQFYKYRNKADADLQSQNIWSFNVTSNSNLWSRMTIENGLHPVGFQDNGLFPLASTLDQEDEYGNNQLDNRTITQFDVSVNKGHNKERIPIIYFESEFNGKSIPIALPDDVYDSRYVNTVKNAASAAQDCKDILDENKEPCMVKDSHNDNAMILDRNDDGTIKFQNKTLESDTKKDCEKKLANARQIAAAALTAMLQTTPVGGR